jgi:outer membrane protein OmpA-like peptidoglycan-associated protein
LDKKAVKLVEKGNEALQERNFTQAQSLFSGAISRDSAYGDAYVKLFGLYHALRQPEEMHKVQLEYVKNVPERLLNRQVWQSLASYEFGRGNYAQADQYLAKATKVDSLLLKSVRFSLSEIQKEDELIITELPSEVNRYVYQYLPALTVDQRTLIYTSRATTEADEDIVVSEFNGQGWSEARSLSDSINTRFNEGACTISADGRTLIFTSCEGRQSYGNCDLYVTQKVGDTWGKPENLGRKVNSTSWDSQPSLSADGRTLYFVSNRPGGQGGRDIWMSVREEEGWSYPKNLGDRINTARDETTPFIHSDNQTLFFSSNGHVGMGGFDLYKILKADSAWQRAQNLGYPINTHQDEVSLIVTADGARAYFAKEETSGASILSSRLVSYDIPDGKQLVAGVTYITGIVRDRISNDPLEASLDIVDLTNRATVYATTSDQLTGRYYIVLPANKQFGAFIEKQGYLFEDLSFSTLNKATDTVNIYLQRIQAGSKLVLKNIYFDFDSDVLDKKSFEELDRVYRLLIENPSVRVEISGHTDSSGTKGYNLDLSKRRAKRVFDHLVTSGVQQGRLSYIGLGDSAPLNADQTEVEKQENRRIEFRIL